MPDRGQVVGIGIFLTRRLLVMDPGLTAALPASLAEYVAYLWPLGAPVYGALRRGGVLGTREK